ncbi:MAG: signal recognition particle-docking protein FtsY [Chloroflexi bacterium]|nr:signal recognition particle-docking protein FtsY [Chloroflexota bacterium]
MPGFLGRINPFRRPLEKTRSGFFDRVSTLFGRGEAITPEFWDALEEMLIDADLADAAGEVLDDLRRRTQEDRIMRTAQVRMLLRDELVRLLGPSRQPLAKVGGLTTVLVAGVNGVGKTTFIAKLAHLLQLQGERVVLAAGDTFRAGAIDQLKVWGERLKVPVVAHQPGGDPGAVVFDAMQRAQSLGSSYCIIDTAGRLHTKHNLMEELRKIERIVKRYDSSAPHETLLVLDAVTGQNAIQQAKKFADTIEITGIVVTKLDGTAKGGALFAVYRELEAPIKFIGTGEQVDDLQAFDAEAFVQALFEEGTE